MTLLQHCLQVGKIAKNNDLKECVFVNLALKIPCYIVKNTLLQIVFSAIGPLSRLIWDFNTILRELIKCFKIKLSV